MKGLSGCTEWSDAECICKLIESVISTILLSAILIELIMTVRGQGRLPDNFPLLIQALIMVSLIFNILNDIWGNIHLFLHMQVFSAKVYFLTILFFVAYKTFRTQLSKRISLCLYFLFTGFYLGLTIERAVTKIDFSYVCIQKWLLLSIDLLAITFSIFLFVFYKRQQIKEASIVQHYFSKNLINNNVNKPFAKMWILILVNIGCVFGNFIRNLTLIIINSFSDTCRFTANRNIEVIINLLLAVFTYFIGFTATIAVFAWLRKLKEKTIQQAQSVQFSSSNDEQIRQNVLQIMGNLSSSSRSKDGSMAP